jgi:hypothetical protein
MCCTVTSPGTTSILITSGCALQAGQRLFRVGWRGGLGQATPSNAAIVFPYDSTYASQRGADDEPVPKECGFLGL